MSFNIGDVVRIGKGKVDYKVSELNPDGTVNLTGERSNRKNVDPSGLTLITDARNAEHASEDVLNAVLFANDGDGTEPNDGFSPETWVLHEDQVEELDETYAEHGMPAAQDRKAEMLKGMLSSEPYAAWEIGVLAPGAKYALHIGYDVQGFKSYGAACDALILARREDAQVPMAIDHNGKRLVTR